MDVFYFQNLSLLVNRPSIRGCIQFRYFGFIISLEYGIVFMALWAVLMSVHLGTLGLSFDNMYVRFA